MRIYTYFNGITHVSCSSSSGSIKDIRALSDIKFILIKKYSIINDKSTKSYIDTLNL
jgi:hypothetical protein